MYVRVVLLVVVTCLLVSASARHSRPRQRKPNKIPERCVQNSITPVRCGRVLTGDQLLPHPDDCQLFYVCEQPYLPPLCRQCPANLHFNPISHVCDWPADANCTVASTVTPGVTGTTDATTPDTILSSSIATQGTDDVSTTETTGVPETTRITEATNVPDKQSTTETTGEPETTGTTEATYVPDKESTTATGEPETTGTTQVTDAAEGPSTIPTSIS